MNGNEKSIIDLNHIDKMFLKLEKFSKINQKFGNVFELINKKEKGTVSKKCEYLLKYLSHEILTVPQYFEDVVTHFAEELPMLLHTLITSNENYSKSNRNKHVSVCVLLSKIVQIKSYLQSFALKYFKENASIFEFADEKLSKKRKKHEEIEFSDLNIAEATYHLLKSNPEFYRNEWKWSIFIEKFFATNSDLKVKWVSCHVVAILCEFHERQLNTLITKTIPTHSADRFLSVFKQNSTLATECIPINQPSNEPIPISYNQQNQKTDRVVSVSGIYLEVLADDVGSQSNLVEVPSTVNNLRKIAMGLTLNRAVCLRGPVGCGKTSSVEYLAWKTGRKLGEKFVKVQLGDQTDSKMLLGTYRCTDIPGEFVWQAGVLTQAVLEGNWLLLEDIDSASMDIASVLSTLLENGSLTVPGYRDSVPVTPGFQLFVTQRLLTSSGYHKQPSNSMTLLEKHLLQINIDPPSPEELKTILITHHKKFHTISDRMIDIFLLFNTETFKITPRLISTRDFFKWCSRAVIDFDVSSQDSALKVLQDGIDVFCCSQPDRNEALHLAKKICTNLGIVDDKAEYFFNNYKPTMKLTSNELMAGRATLKRNHEKLVERFNFSFTRHSSVLIERIMCCVKSKEPVLLVGETGTGKTSCVQYLANTLGQKLIVINMNQQSDSADLLGGYKPVDMKFVLSPLRREFEQVFCDYFKVEPNRKFLSNIALCFNKQRWRDLFKLIDVSCRAALERLRNGNDEEMLTRWSRINEKLQKIQLQWKKNVLTFSFVEGSLVKAVENGYWVLLDEINLANAETLECLSGLLEGTDGSLCLLERGDKFPVKRHSNFTLFACMNPSTDVGKKDLPMGLRNRFTEFFVEELNERNDLFLLVGNYLQAMSLKQNELENIVEFYLRVRREMEESLCDGSGHKPHFSLRSLCRALTVASWNPCGTFKRSLYEAFCLSFLTQLNAESYGIVQDLISRYLIGHGKMVKSVLNQPIPKPVEKNEEFLQFEGYWVKKGSVELAAPDDYILTQSVRKNLKDLTRVVSIGKLPVLLQGDTSVGKTSLITYLAKSSGNKCVRINNHEHTDLQEYIGSYVADSDGKLVFREGLLVEAMRNGHWIILDELNLAPTDVLEALNRVLDDNRELFIPETQQVVKADENFMLFATQNPPGLYGGRKELSRAFRNRFVELHFEEIPAAELEFILHKRCRMAMSYAKKMVGVMTELQVRRKGSATFAGKHGFMTLRDLFRWGERYRLAENKPNLYDWDQHLADEGYLVLAGRVRKLEEKMEIIKVLQKQLKRNVQPDALFTLSEKTSPVTRHILEQIKLNEHKNKNIVWTFPMRQLAVLICKAVEFKEPILLVGETGGGKTTVCKLIAEFNQQKLITVNCHMHTESGDFIGGLRPVRDRSTSTKLFEWVDGPLIEAMLLGQVFLADEISLADDSVLERLNSLLEPERTLLLAEKGIDSERKEKDCELIVAHENFIFIGTMNPGGDFGKKELSPALRNRFTEIWCDSCTDRDDLIAIIEKNVMQSGEGIGVKIMDFVEWFRTNEIGKRITISIRDILTWTSFINSCNGKINLDEAYVHGAHLTFLDSLGSGLTSTESIDSLKAFKKECENFLYRQTSFKCEELPELKVKIVDNKFGIDPFYIECKNGFNATEFSFNAPTTLYNTRIILKAMQLNKAILLEGSPGVGKTSLVTALANVTGNELFRVNLSDQTDISDLFGADLPVEGGKAGHFSWRDGPLLKALKDGSWILLDELNLASQSVLEGLNACLDHRGEIFIPELGKTFHIKPGTKFFGCQNPSKQGGARRGLPRSFLNRFTQVHIRALTDSDFNWILCNQFKEIPREVIGKMNEFNRKIGEELDRHNFGHKGAPWECNLRDLIRWCQSTLHLSNTTGSFQPENTAHLMYADRMRTAQDKEKIREIFFEIFQKNFNCLHPLTYINRDRIYFGDVNIERADSGINFNVLKLDKPYLLLREQSGVLRSLAWCVNMNWMAVLVGSSGSGKSSIVKTLANLVGKCLRTLPVTSAMDTSDLLGGFEQTDYGRHLDEITKETERSYFEILQELLINGKNEVAMNLLTSWESFQEINEMKKQSMQEELKLFLKKSEKLVEIISILELHRKDSNLKNLKKKLKNIMKIVEEDGSLNAGGKFEWVDSILVKCLQEGSWLLMENVNLCSSAVLDRLNALLEPGGVLTLSERGVDEEGRMIHIKPHEDFRIFLTMDPKNGEISRAMRNRGIEICILDEKCTMNKFDVMSLIHSEGLTDVFYINILLKIHDFISDLIYGEKPKINELIQSASMISQQLSHGISLHDAFYDTIVEIYFKPRLLQEFNCNDPIEIIKNEIGNVMGGVQKFDYFNSNVTVNVENCNFWSCFEKIEQDFAIYNTFLTQELKQHLPYLTVIFYSLSTVNDLKLRSLMFKDRIKDENLTNLNKNLQEVVTKYTNNADENLPLDRNWFYNINYKNTSNVESNRLNLNLYVALFNFIEEMEYLKVKNETTKELTLLDYMQQKTFRKDKFGDTIIEFYLKIKYEYDSYLNYAIKNTDKVDNSNIFRIIYLIIWRYIFQKATLVNIRNIDSSQKLNILTNLHVHYKWFLKYAVNQFGEEIGINPDENFQLILNEINKSSLFSQIYKIGKSYQKTIDRPKPFVNQEQLNAATYFNEINRFYDYCNRISDIPTIYATFKRNKELRTLLIDVKTNLRNQCVDLNKKIQILKKLDEVVKKDEINPDNFIFEINILPIQDYFLRLQIYKNDIYSIKNNELFPVDLIPLNGDESGCEFNKKFYLYLLNSISMRTENGPVSNNLFSPRLTYFVTNILMKDGISLGTFRCSQKQLGHLNLLLWNNFYQMSEEQYDLLHNEKNRILCIYKNFLSNLENALSSKIYEEKCDDLQQLFTKLNLKFVSKTLQECQLNFNKLSSSLKRSLEDDFLNISDLYMKLGYLKAQFNAQLPLIDPLIKKRLKRKYCEEISAIYEKIKECYELQNMLYSNVKDTRHSYCESIENQIGKLVEMRGNLGKFVAVRSEDVLYNSVKTVVQYAFNTILSESTISKMISNLNYLIINISIAVSKREKIDFNHFTSKLTQYESSVTSYNNLLDEWSKFESSYPDIVEPLLGDLSEFLYGLTMKVSLLKMFVMRYKYLSFDVVLKESLVNLMKFPIVCKTQNNYEFHIEMLNSKLLVDFIEAVLKDEENLKNEAVLRLKKCGLYESFNLCIVDANSFGVLNKNLFFKFSQTIDAFVASWNLQQKEKEEKEKEAESLYKIKTKCDEKTDEEHTNEEIKELFTNYHDQDFVDFEISLESTKHEVEPEKLKDNLTFKDLQEIIELHDVLVKYYTKSEWLNPVKNKNVTYDFIKPLMGKFNIFNKIFNKVINCLDYKIDSKLIGSMNTLLAVIKKYGETTELSDKSVSSQGILNKRLPDFYKDSNVEEVKCCYHILEELRLKVLEFLNEWPEQPTLMKILNVIDRIYSFNIKSPIARFLTGLEILLTKCYEWEQVAHSGNSLSHFYKHLTDQIINWRKLELSMWKDLLNTAYEKMNETLPKWWLYLYNVMRQFVVEKLFDKTDLVITLQDFITKSNLAEFHGRLNLLYTFHCHSIHLDRNERSIEFTNILWNVHNYFRQFDLVVSNKIKDLRSPIERKLKDYVKIVRWKDVNYWSVKIAVDKSHKILHKHYKEYKEVLMQPVKPFLTNTVTIGNENVGIWDRPQRQSPKTYHYVLDPDCYIVKQSAYKKIQNIDSTKMEKYFQTTRKLCKEAILKTNYPELIQNLDGFVTEIIETSAHLQNLEVDTSLSKEKQKSQAKNILQQKHRALSDLFKNLYKMGLSFKTGLVQQKLQNPCDSFVIKPVDLNVNFNSKNSRDEKILTLWDSCELYYVRSLMRNDLLESALLNPAKDLGLQNIERCKGFSNNLLVTEQKLKSTLIESTRNFYYLKHYIKQLTDICKGKEFLHTITVEGLKKLLIKSQITLNQFKIILNTCPEQNSFENYEIVLLKSDIEERIFFKNDDLWCKAMGLINKSVNRCFDLCNYLNKCEGMIICNEYDLITAQYIPINEKAMIRDNINEIIKDISMLRQIFGNIEISDGLLLLEREYSELNLDVIENINITSDEEYEKNMQKLVEIILITIQNTYKKYTSLKPEEEEETVANNLKEEHLKKLLIENLSLDIALLNVPKILKKIVNISKFLFNTPPNYSQNMITSTHQILPLLEQFIQIFEYFITNLVSTYRVTCKMTSILLNIFIELSSKGFCVPPEFSEEIQDEGISKPSDGLGLGDGEGEKDVSDKIESEDQLDEARQAGKEKEKDEDDDKDCKEEDNGIEMSEDFEGKLQEKERNKDENEDENKSDDDSDAEEQMGETGEHADKLDKEIWGSDSEENEENENAKDEESKSGEQQDNNEIGAKTDNNDESEQNESNKDKENERTKPEINEMQEPEYDDDQIDPNHGKQPDLPEPEPMDLPDDLQLDDGMEKNEEDADTQEDNPFNIDIMKEQNIPEDKKDEDNEKDDNDNDEAKSFSSDDEEITRKEKHEETEEDEEGINDDGNKKDEDIENENNDDGTEAESSGADQSQTNQENVQAMDVDDAEATDKVQTQNDQHNKNNSNDTAEDTCLENDKPDDEGVGQSQTDEKQSGHSSQTNLSQEIRASKRDLETEKSRREKPGESDSQRSLGDVNEPVKKKLKTLDSKILSDENFNNDDHDDEEAEMYQHIKDAKELKSQTLDVATEEQVEVQKKEVPNEENDEHVEKPTESNEDLPMSDKENDEDMEVVNSEVIEKEKTDRVNKEKKVKEKQHQEGEILEDSQKVTIDGDIIETITTSRSAETTHHTRYDNLADTVSDIRLTFEELNNIRSEVEKQLSTWHEGPSNEEAERAWQRINSITMNLARDLSEQLRLVLEPTRASRLKGDFRTGKRINMRKVIPYIASDFRKDKIWLRRTKPSKREYQIILAIDDSSSMCDNHSKELAFESVSLISKALTLLESGELSVISFGEQVEIIHKLSDQFTDKTGVKLLQKFNFNQKKTCVAQLVDFTAEMLRDSPRTTGIANAKLLIIISDGRGVFSEGETKVKHAVRRAKLEGVFMVFVIVDNPLNKNSILDIRMPVFKDGKLQHIQNYMDVFPFSFYIILRDINTLPNILSDALRQWFEIVSNSDK